MPAGRQAGFTLLEVLIAVVVLGILVAGLSQGVRLGIAAWTRQAALVGETADLDAVDRVVRSLLANATSGAIRGRNDFAGASDSLTFDGLLPLAVSVGSRQAKITLALDERHRLMLRWQTMLLDPNTGQPTTDEVPIIDHLDGIAFAYWRGSGEAPGWQNQWSATTPPPLIRVHLVFGEHDRRHWPDIVVGPLVEEGGG
jgi:general secretion pathway protein J